MKHARSRPSDGRAPLGSHDGPIGAHAQRLSHRSRVIVGVFELVGALGLSVFLVSGQASPSHVSTSTSRASHPSYSVLARDTHHGVLAGDAVLTRPLVSHATSPRQR